MVLAAVFTAAYLSFYEWQSGATYHESAKLASLLRDVATFVPFLAPVFALEILLGKKSGLRTLSLVAYFVLHVVTDAAYIATRGHLDYAFVRDNIAEASSGPALDMLVGAITTPLRALVLGELALVVFFFGARPLRPVRYGERIRAALLAACLGSYALAFVGFLPTRDSVTSYGSSIFQYYSANTRMADARAKTPGSYPLVHTPALSALPPGVVAPSANARPNVILVLLESFSAAYVGVNAKDGAPYTPTMNAHIAAGLSAPHFYGNSVQTCHGHFAALCSLVPSYRKKEAYLDPLDLACLPDVLRSQGYRTALFTGSEDERFDRIDEFGKKMGFDEVHSAEAAVLNDDDRSHMWGWGLQDDYFYAWALKILDASLAAKKDGQPFFLTLAPVSNHYPFNEEPGRAALVGEETPARANYASSLRASDLRLAALFKLLGDRGLRDSTVVVLTGDHSFPADEHGSHWNERGFYEESFRVPFVLEWPGHVPAIKLGDRAFSQIDIAPTLIDLLRIERPVAFAGRSMFDPADAPPFVPLVQPYDGQYLGAVAWPFKYREHALTGQNVLFNLENDPLEMHPISVEDAPRDVSARLKADVERIHLSQALLQSNQVWK